MDRVQLPVTPRDIVGKKVKQLRKSGIVPGHIYGYQTQPINVGVNYDQLLQTVRHSGDTGLVDVVLDGKTYPVLIKDVQTHAVSGEMLNVDFFKVNLKEKVTVTVPIIPVGEPEAVASKIGLLEQPLSEVEIEALPTDLIEHIEVDVSGLAEMDQAIYASDLKVPQTVALIIDEPEMVMVFKIGELVTEEMAEALEAEEAATAEAETGEEGKQETNAEEATAEENTNDEAAEG